MKNSLGKTLLILAIAGIISACASAFVSGSKTAPAGKEDKDEVQLFEVRSPQELVYNGKPQGIPYLYNGQDKIDITYFTSPRDRMDDRRGTQSEPVDVGIYYVRLIRPGKGKTVPAKEVFANLNIVKRPVKITAAKTQEAVYDGDPKRIQAAAEPSVSLSYSYYPNLELLETAKKSTAETPQGQSTITQTFRGYRRIDRAPSEPGTYYVWIYYPGDNNNETASLDVVLTIFPPEE